MKKKIDKAVLLVLKIAILALCIPILLYAQGRRSLTYLPRDEFVTTVDKSYSPELLLNERDCPTVSDLLMRVKDCMTCAFNLKPSCPSCCLVYLPAGYATRCSPEASEGYNCRPAAFNEVDVGVCTGFDCDTPDVIPFCQQRGCGDLEPKPDHDDACIFSPTSIYDPDGELIDDNFPQWICSGSDSYAPRKVPLEPSAESGLLDDQDSYPDPQTTPYYQSVTSLSDCPDEEELRDSGHPCYQYLPEYAWVKYIQRCFNYTRQWVGCQKTVYCCKKGTCPRCCDSYCETRICNPDPADDRTGFNLNCLQDPNRDLYKCQERIAMPKCLPGCVSGDPDDPCYTDADVCLRLNQRLTDRIGDPNDRAIQACFRELDSDLEYKFIAKSNDRIVAIWQIQAVPRFRCTAADCTTILPADANCPPPEHIYFYTKVKIVDLDLDRSSGGRIVHESIVNEKSFTGMFSIFSATVNSEALIPGHRYVVKLYYFLPPLCDYRLWAEISGAQLIIFRVRE